MNFEVQKGELLVVIGAVGCGKTSLLHALMGETSVTGGVHNVKGSIAYVE